MEQVFFILVLFFLCGVLGFCIGRDGFIENSFWVGCTFNGTPPKEYKSWQEFVMSKVKSGVEIKSI
jgi:hypothetical protein